VMRLHAEYYREFFAKSEANAFARSKGEWVADYGREVGNLRAALDWAFSPDGASAFGVALAAAATNFWIAMSLLSEGRDWAAKALARLGTAAGTHEEMVLQCGLGIGLTYGSGTTPDARAALTKALTLAENLTELNYQFRVLAALWLF